MRRLLFVLVAAMSPFSLAASETAPLVTPPPRDSRGAMLDEATALALVDRGGFIRLDHVTGLNDRIADILSRHTGPLSLDGITTLPPVIAKALARHRGDLYLDGVGEIEAEAAAYLSRHRGPLHMRNLTSLTSSSLAAALARSCGGVGAPWFPQLRRLSASAAEELQTTAGLELEELFMTGGRAGVARFGKLDSRSVAAVSSIDTFGFRFECDAVTPAITTAIGDFLSNRHNSSNKVEPPHLVLLRTPALTVETAFVPSVSDGCLHVRGLASLDAQVAGALAQFEGRELAVEIATELPVATASALACYGGYLAVEAPLSRDALAALCQHTGPLALPRLQSLDAGMAAILARHEGDLELDGLAAVTAATAAAVAKHRGSLRLAGLETIDPDVAAGFAEHAARLELDAIENIDDDAAAALAGHTGPLVMRGLRRLSSAALTQKLLASAEQAGNEGLDDEALPAAIDSVTTPVAEFLATPAVLDRLYRWSFTWPLLVPARLESEALALGYVARAEALAQGEEPQLELPSVRSLSRTAAAALARFRGALVLDGLVDLPPDIAAALARHTGELSLGGLQSIEVESVRQLAGHEGPVIFVGLRSIKVAVADALAALPTPIQLPNLDCSDHAGLARKLGLEEPGAIVPASKDGVFSFRALVGAEVAARLVDDAVRESYEALTWQADESVRLDAVAASELARFRGQLVIAAPFTLADDSAKALAKHDGAIVFTDLCDLSADAARALAPHRGLVVLGGVTDVRAEVAEEIASFQGPVILPHLIVLESPALADKLVASPYSDDTVWIESRGLPDWTRWSPEGLSPDDQERLRLFLCERVSPAAAARLAEYPGWIRLGVTELPADVAAAFAAHKGTLELPVLTDLSEDAADAIAAHQGPLVLPRLQTLQSASLARKLLAQHGDHGWPELAAITPAAAAMVGEFPDIDALDFSSLETVSVEVATQLARFPSRLRVGGVTPLGAATAQALAEHRGGLTLTGLPTLSSESAEQLAKHEGGLSLDLRLLPGVIAAALSTHRGPIDLPGLRNLDDDAAARLESFTNDLALDRVTNLSRAAQDSLARCVGNVSVRSLKVISSPSLCRKLVEQKRRVQPGKVIDLMYGFPEITVEAVLALDDFTESVQLGFTLVSPAMAEALGRLGTHIELPNLDALESEALAAKLVRDAAGGVLRVGFEGASRGRWALPPRVRSLTPAVAAALAAHRGELRLPGLRAIDGDVAGCLAEHEGKLVISPECRLTEEAVATFRKRKPDAIPSPRP